MPFFGMRARDVAFFSMARGPIIYEYKDKLFLVMARTIRVILIRVSSANDASARTKAPIFCLFWNRRVRSEYPYCGPYNCGSAR